MSNSNLNPGPFIQVKNWVVPTGICESNKTNPCPSTTLNEAIIRCQSITGCDSVVEFEKNFQPTISTSAPGFITDNTISYFTKLDYGLDAFKKKNELNQSTKNGITTVQISNFDNTDVNYNEYYIILFCLVLIGLLYYYHIKNN
jgi:hypothetical protein